MGWLGSLLGGAVGAIPGVGQVAQLGLGALGAITGAKKGAQADKLNSQRLQLAQQHYDAGAPFRSKLADTAFAIPTQREDLSSLFTDPGNPYARQAPRPPQTHTIDLGQLPGVPPQAPRPPSGIMDRLQQRIPGGRV